MSPIYETSPFQFEPDPALAALIVRAVTVKGWIHIQDVIDGCRFAGFDRRATAMEIGILIMDGVIRPILGSTESDRWTMVELADSGQVDEPPPMEV